MSSRRQRYLSSPMVAFMMKPCILYSGSLMDSCTLSSVTNVTSKEHKLRSSGRCCSSTVKSVAAFM